MQVLVTYPDQDLQEVWPDIPAGDGTDVPHIVYDLGPDIPVGTVTTKGVYATARVWTLLDQLLTQRGLAEAIRSSRALARGGTRDLADHAAE